MAFPEAVDTNTSSNNVIEARSADGLVLGYISVGEASGYGGPLSVVLAMDTAGNTSSLAVVDHRETPTFFDKTIKSGILKNLVKTKAYDPIKMDEDIDGLSGATYTARALIQSSQQAAHQIGRTKLNLEIPEDKREIQFGLPEILLIVLFLIAVLQRKYFKGKTRNIIRWATLITGMIFLGFIYNRPFVLAHVNMVILGYFPDWHTHIYWYILIAGLLLFKTEKKWNTYCYDFCPFGACQEVVGAIGGAKPIKIKWSETLKWLQRALVIFAVSLALIYRNPGSFSFEIFGTLFALEGSNFQFVVLAIVLLSSLFISRPFCNYLCPLHKNTMEGLFDRTRKNFKKIWQNLFP
ncbi:MAG: FMN-binding protein, partial [Cyclobacteriaceae bacterium]|nr:FMN-binding protein [Cyclobacteriaceae bacterium]